MSPGAGDHRIWREHSDGREHGAGAVPPRALRKCTGAPTREMVTCRLWCLVCGGQKGTVWGKQEGTVWQQAGAHSMWCAGGHRMAACRRPQYGGKQEGTVCGGQHGTVWGQAEGHGMGENRRAQYVMGRRAQYRGRQKGTVCGGQEGTVWGQARRHSMWWAEGHSMAQQQCLHFLPALFSMKLSLLSKLYCSL